VKAYRNFYRIWLDDSYLPVGSLQGNDRNDSADYSPMKKSIWVSHTRWSPDLNELIDLAVNRYILGLLITRSEKKCRLRMLWAEWCFSGFKLWPRVPVSKLKSKNFEAGIEDWPVMILNTSTRSAHLRRSSSDHKPSSLRRSLYGSPLSSLNRRVNPCWTLSIVSLTVTRWKQNTLRPTWGRTMVLYIFNKIVAFRETTVLFKRPSLL